jgi:hypothetical protein
MVFKNGMKESLMDKYPKLDYADAQLILAVLIVRALLTAFAVLTTPLRTDFCNGLEIKKAIAKLAIAFFLLFVIH